MKTNLLNMLKVNNKGTRLIHVTLFRGMGIEDPLKHLTFLKKNSSQTKAKSFNWVLNIPLNFEYISHTVMVLPLLTLNK